MTNGGDEGDDSDDEDDDVMMMLVMMMKLSVSLSQVLNSAPTSWRLINIRLCRSGSPNVPNFPSHPGTSHLTSATEPTCSSLTPPLGTSDPCVSPVSRCPCLTAARRWTFPVMRNLPRPW